MGGRIERWLSIAMSLATIVVAVGFLARSYRAGRAETARPASAVFVKNWLTVAPVSIAIGNNAAPVRLVEFSDLECPFCAAFHRALRSVATERPGQIQLLFVHLPLPGHRFARPAARVVECAGQSGRAGEMIEAVFENQDSLGLKSWGRFAATAGIVDTTTLVKCAAQASVLPRVEAGVALARAMGIRATPTVFVNGWRLPRPPDESELRRIIREVLDGKAPSM